VPLEIGIGDFAITGTGMRGVLFGLAPYNQNPDFDLKYPYMLC
jgi:hypothetical protein